MIEKKIGLKIRQIRKNWGLSQIDLAERIGISFQQIQKYEKGSTRISVMRLQQISEAFGINITTFFEEGKSALKVSDHALKYNSGGDPIETFRPLDKEEMTLLKLFRKTRNKNLREGIIKQLRGIIELENQK
ncbi:MAG: helix-turn-helix transcriptional regulator [Desulfobacteraceae bacterium]|uniref:Helix-turn-helix transcriptional regulator n=1 Tax=Candidatus Desulfaltia bathyphila TaxID=2841697 RepID=A0A8J6N4K1_9BACT|nr:helix-turn-helix transcriptional regulator [Candidatus Desulfaltia bathyphila]